MKKFMLLPLFVFLCSVAFAQAVDGVIMMVDDSTKTIIVQHDNGTTDRSFSFVILTFGPKNWGLFGHILQENDYIAVETKNKLVKNEGNGELTGHVMVVNEIHRPVPIYSSRKRPVK